MEKVRKKEKETLILVANIPVKIVIDESWLKPKIRAETTTLDKQNKIQRVSE